MANEVAKRDQNSVPVLTGITDNAAQEIRMIRVDPITGRVLVSTVSSGGSFSALTATGTVNAANKIFTFTSVPTYIVSDGVWYPAQGMNVPPDTNWTNVGTTVTMIIPPQSFIFGVLIS